MISSLMQRVSTSRGTKVRQRQRLAVLATRSQQPGGVLPAQAHRGSRWLDTPYPHYFNYPTPVQFCHELHFYFSAISQIEESHPGFLFFCKLILHAGATATRIEPRPLNLRKFRERFFRESG